MLNCTATLSILQSVIHRSGLEDLGWGSHIHSCSRSQSISCCYMCMCVRNCILYTSPWHAPLNCCRCLATLATNTNTSSYLGMYHRYKNVGEEDGQRPRCSLQIMHAKGKCEKDSTRLGVNCSVCRCFTCEHRNKCKLMRVTKMCA